MVVGSVMRVLGLGEDQYGLSPLSHHPASPSENAEPFSTPLPSKDMNFPQVEEQIHFRVRALLYDLQCETGGGVEEMLSWVPAIQASVGRARLQCGWLYRNLSAILGTKTLERQCFTR